MVDKQESEREKDKAEKLNAETRLGRRQQPPPFIYETRTGGIGGVRVGRSVDHRRWIWPLTSGAPSFVYFRPYRTTT
ncbi:chloroplastic,Red chlorophyll catabolite reductase 1 [Trichinella spiralis]